MSGQRRLLAASGISVLTLPALVLLWFLFGSLLLLSDCSFNFFDPFFGRRVLIQGLDTGGKGFGSSCVLLGERNHILFFTSIIPLHPSSIRAPSMIPSIS